MKYLILNQIRRLESIINEKLGITGWIARVVIYGYVLLLIVIGVILPYIAYNNVRLEIYSIVLSSWIILSLPPYHTMIRRLYLQDQMIKNMVFAPLAIISMLKHPLWASGIMSVSWVLNRYAYHRGVIFLTKGYGRYFLVLLTFVMVIIAHPILGLSLLIVTTILFCKYPQLRYRTMILDGELAFLGLFLLKDWIAQYDTYGVILIGIYMTVLTRNALQCQQEQFLNVNKLMMNVTQLSENRLLRAFRYDSYLIYLFIVVHFPLTFMVVYEKTINSLYTLLIAVLVSLLQYTLYQDLLLFATYKFYKSQILISNEVDLINFRYSPLFILSTVPIVSVYYLYSIFSLKVVVVFSLLFIVAILTTYFSYRNFRHALQQLLEELK